MKPDPLPGFVWLDTPGKVLHVDEHVLGFTNVPLLTRESLRTSRTRASGPDCG